MSDFEEVKFFDKERNVFIYRKIDGGEPTEEIIFDTFRKFAKFLKGDLSTCNLLDYNFKGVDLRKYKLKDAGISSSVLIEQGLYCGSFYDENVRDIDDIFIASRKGCEVAVVYDNNPIDIAELRISKDWLIYYVTDLHLDHMIKKRFQDHASEYEIRNYLKEISEGISNDINHVVSKMFLFIGGDVSHNYNITRIFYEELIKVISPRKIIAILGNHELWGYGHEGIASIKDKLSLKEIISDYRVLFRDLGITFLHNELLAFSRNGVQTLNEIDLAELGDDVLKKICASHNPIILGGVGFSGYNNQFNAKDGIYRDTIYDQTDEMIETKKFEKIYCRIESAVSDLPVIVFTHMPKESWTMRPYNKNWIYVNGHSHVNNFHVDTEKTVYSDNQIGYHGNNIRLKHFRTQGEYDPFRYYEDGIHEIDRSDYVDFYHGIEVNMQCDRKNRVIYMLKNKGIYCFLSKNCETGKIYFLAGGREKSIKIQDLSYYFDNLKLYSEAISGSVEDHNRLLKRISNAVKDFGGDGGIHGLIVNIDIYNHIYLNPLDGKITPYYAIDIEQKWAYKNIASLLFFKKPDLYDRYKMIVDASSKDNVPAVIRNNGMEIIKDRDFVGSTAMYRASRNMLALQYNTNYRVVRKWDDRILELNLGERKKWLIEFLLEIELKQPYLGIE